MQVQQLMTRDVELVSPDTPIEEAAKRMRNSDVGALPVGADDRLVGMVSDRDIAVRGVAAGRTDATVGDIVSDGILYCFDDEEVERAANLMGEHQIRRLPVLNRDKRLVGIVSLGDISRRDDDSAGVALADVSAGSRSPRS
ncbi:CBS domain-containing protein [Stakelama saccharophila]|uniref:CBS domain-containing protein n=1 Tax=Stakelama saccharophila TaxID=3075605 RepID=A0ABZ0B9R7_9SPHN|nr:CBS domain-containing protein [Stakelama sp. W311]WNO53815.1 CBS domain-containing protein [Stakelama sp. W311]